MFLISLGRLFQSKAKLKNLPELCSNHVMFPRGPLSLMDRHPAPNSAEICLRFSFILTDLAD